MALFFERGFWRLHFLVFGSHFRCALLLLGAHLSRPKQCVGLLRAASAC